MRSTNTQTDQRGLVRRYDYEHESVVVADTGLDADVSVDTLERTAIVVVEGDEDAQYELELPDGEVSRAYVNNGIVTVEVER